MSPDIWILGGTFYKSGLVASLPDVSGVYETEKGPIEVEMDPPEKETRPNSIAVTWDGFRGHLRQSRPNGTPYYGRPRRVIDLGRNGIGSQSLSTNDEVQVILKERSR